MKFDEGWVDWLWLSPHPAGLSFPLLRGRENKMKNLMGQDKRPENHLPMILMGKTWHLGELIQFIPIWKRLGGWEQKTKMKSPRARSFSLLLLPSHTYPLLQTRVFHVVLQKPFQQGIFHRLQSSKNNLLLCGVPVGHSSYRKYSSSPTCCFPASSYFSLVLTDDYDINYLSFHVFHSNKI